MPTHPIPRVLLGLFYLILIQGIFQGIHLAGYCPDKWVAQMITATPSASLLGIVYWGLSAVAAAILWFVSDRLLYRRKPNPDDAKKSSPDNGGSYPLAVVADIPKGPALYPPEAMTTKRFDILELGRSVEKEMAAVVGDTWLLPPNAVTVFGSPDLTIRLRELFEQSEAVHARAVEYEEKIREIRQSVEGGRDYNSYQARENAIDSWRAKLSEAAFEGDAIRRDIRVTQISLENQIHRALETGELVAKGFRYPNNEDEILIPASKWRDMSIDFISFKALRRDGGDVLFTSILIGRPITKDKSKSSDMLVQQATERQRIEAAKAADFRASDRLDEFTLKQAAQYWVGDRPAKKDEEMTQQATIVLRELISVANGGLLTASPATYPEWMLTLGATIATVFDLRVGQHDGNSSATRKSLRAYALSKPERPLFLFPEDR